jgi:hypothetical protein
MVQIMGFVEDEKIFSTLVFMKKIEIGFVNI